MKHALPLMTALYFSGAWTSALILPLIQPKTLCLPFKRVK